MLRADRSAGESGGRPERSDIGAARREPRPPSSLPVGGGLFPLGEYRQLEAGDLDLAATQLDRRVGAQGLRPVGRLRGGGRYRLEVDGVPRTTPRRGRGVRRRGLLERGRNGRTARLTATTRRDGVRVSGSGCPPDGGSGYASS